MPPESTHTHTLTTGFELNEFRPFSTAVGTSLKKVMVKMFTGSVILSEVWTRKSCVTSDLKAELHNTPTFDDSNRKNTLRRVNYRSELFS